MLTVASVNVNGIRAAQRRGVQPWLAAREPAVLCLQEVRATADVLRERLGDDWYVAYADCETPGRAGVAVASRRPLARVQAGLGLGSVDSGRWVEADLPLAGGATLTVASAYVHTGEAGTPHQADKSASCTPCSTASPSSPPTAATSCSPATSMLPTATLT